MERPEPRAGFRRVYCGCGCGTWFYAERRNGRPPAYLNDDHYRIERNRRMRNRMRAPPTREAE